MVFSRKRKDNRSPSFVLDESPKRTKVQAQRKFAQGSNVNSPVLTPVQEIEQQDKVIPEPIELLPMKRPNTEDFLTFLCFRGTPVLPPSLNFFNNASMVDTRPQTNDSPTTSPKNGVILTGNISKTQGERPFIAFGVRKRADPIVVSRHMDKKRRHALALQALRRKYQEQKMAKIRAITISKLSEKVQTNKTIVRTTRSITKSEPITKKSITQKTKITVVATKHVKVTTRRTSSLKQPVRSNIKQKMCLRSYRGRFVQRELLNKPVKKRAVSKHAGNKGEEASTEEEEFSSDDNEPLMKCIEPKAAQKITKKTTMLPKKAEITYRLTRSNQVMTRRHPTQTRLLVRAQNKLKTPTTTPRLRPPLQRKIQGKEIKLPIKKKLIKNMEVKRKTLTSKYDKIKVVQSKPTDKLVKTIPEREVKRKNDEASDSKTKKSVVVTETISKKIDGNKAMDKSEVKKKAEIGVPVSEKRTTRETTKKKTEETVEKKKTSLEHVKLGKDTEKKKVTNDLSKSTRSNDLCKTTKSNDTQKNVKNDVTKIVKAIDKKVPCKDLPKIVKELIKKSNKPENKNNDLPKIVRIAEKKVTTKDVVKIVKDPAKKNESNVLKIEKVPRETAQKSMCNESTKIDAPKVEKKVANAAPIKLVKELNKNKLNLPIVNKNTTNDFKGSEKKSECNKISKETKVTATLTKKKDIVKVIKDAAKKSDIKIDKTSAAAKESDAIIGIQDMSNAVSTQITKKSDSNALKNDTATKVYKEMDKNNEATKSNTTNIGKNTPDHNESPKVSQNVNLLNTVVKEDKDIGNKISNVNEEIKDNVLSKISKGKRVVNIVQGTHSDIFAEEMNKSNEGASTIKMKTRLDHKTDFCISKDVVMKNIVDDSRGSEEKNINVRKELSVCKNFVPQTELIKNGKDCTRKSNITENVKLNIIPNDIPSKIPFNLATMHFRNNANTLDENIQAVDLRKKSINILEDVKLVTANADQYCSIKLLDHIPVKEYEKKDVISVEQKDVILTSTTGIAVEKIEEETTVKNPLLIDDITKSVMEVMEEKRKSIRETRTAVFEESKKLQMELEQKKLVTKSFNKNETAKKMVLPLKTSSQHLCVGERAKLCDNQQSVEGSFKDVKTAKRQMAVKESNKKSVSVIPTLQSASSSRSLGQSLIQEQSEDISKTSAVKTILSPDKIKKVITNVENLILAQKVDKVKEKTIADEILEELMSNKSLGNQFFRKKVIPVITTKKTPKITAPKVEEPQVVRRPTRKTKEAAAIYMEILGHRLGNDEDEDDNNSIDSFPELPNVRKMEQRENELKAKAIKEAEKPVEVINNPEEKKGTDVIVVNDTSKCVDLRKKESEAITKQPAKNPKKERKKSNTDKKQKNTSSKILRGPDSDSDVSFTAEIKTPPEKLCRQTRNRSPKLYKSFSDTDSEPSFVPVKKPQVKRKSNNVNSESDNSATAKCKKKPKKVIDVKEDSFGESDEEPLVKLTQKKAEEMKKPLDEPVVLMKQKRECTKRPQNYLPLFSSSDEEEKYFHGFVKSESPPKPIIPKVEPPIDLLSTKDVGRRYGKEKVNMSNEQIEKWLNDSALAGMSLIKKENDEMLKFGEKIPTETSLDASLVDINTDGLKDSLLKPVAKEVKKMASPDPTPEKYVAAMKPFSNERKTIFRKEKKEPYRNVNAFSVCNESSVYAFEADHEDLISTPFRRPSRRPSSTTTSRSEDDLARLDAEQKAPGKFRHPNLIRTDSNAKTSSKPEITLTDESNVSGSAPVSLETTEEVNISGTDNEQHHFYIPMQPGQKSTMHIPSTIKSTEAVGHHKLLVGNKVVSHKTPKLQDKPLAASSPMFPPTQTTLQKSKTDSRTMRPSCSKSSDRLSENSEDFKYKVPSSPSASSSSSTKLYKRQAKSKSFESYVPVNTTEFPNQVGPAHIVEAPVFHPSEKEFIDPIEYIEKIRIKAEKFGICRIVPPPNFKPECKVLDEMRFTAYNQYVHKMMDRWGPNFRELIAIRKYLATQSISLKHPPWIGGMEIDLPRLYQTVQTLGGLKEVIEKKKWPKVSDLMKIPKSAQDRVTKLDDIYCKYLLPYDTLSPDERDKLFDAVETEWAKRESKNLLKSQQTTDDKKSDDEDNESNDEEESDIECIIKGRSMALSAFYRIARNTMATWFKSEPSAKEVEEEFWKHVTTKQYHICVHSGSIDSGNWGYGFAVSKNSPFARHAWNLKVLTNNSGSVLRYLGPVMGLTVPTLHVGMVFSGCCWYRDPHSLPWIEYLHTGGNKIWYGIPDTMSQKFHSTLLKLVPNYCLNKSIWLPSDTAMLPPNLLVDNGVSLTRTVQEPGQFVVIFPKAFTSNICTGYVVSESVFFAPPNWLNCAEYVFDELRQSCEPSMFSHERLLLSVATDPRSDVNLLNQVIPAVRKLCEREIKQRQELKALGVTLEERLPLPDNRKKKKTHDSETEYACEDCRWNLFCSMVLESQENAIYCLEHAIVHLQKKTLEPDKCKLMYTYNSAELNVLVDRVKATIEAKIQKKAGGKYHGMPTLLT